MNILMKVGMALKRTMKLRQPNQEEGMKDAKSPLFKHMKNDNGQVRENHHLRHPDFHEILFIHKIKFRPSPDSDLGSRVNA